MTNLKKGDLLKIWTTPFRYGIFDFYGSSGHMYLYDSTIPYENRSGISGRTDTDRNRNQDFLRRRTKVSVLNSKNFDKQIRQFGLVVRDGRFYDRLSMTNETALELAKAFERVRKSLKQTT